MRPSRLVRLGCCLGSLLACSAPARVVPARPQEPSTAPNSAASSSVPPASSPAVSSPPPSPAPPSPLLPNPLLPSPAPAGAAPTVPRGLAELGPFYDRLEALERGERLEAVRVLWLGDSHTAADFMTDLVRQRLSLWGGYGGPGFLQLGLAQYRHAGAKLETTGKWRHQPILPAQRTRVLDGVFGYGGQRTIPTEGASVRVELKPGRLAPEEAMRWTLVVRLGPGDRLEAAVGSSRRVIEHETDGGEPLRELSFDAPAREAFSLRHLAGAPEIFGVFVDRVRPGVVLDNAGINGARVATPLAWEPAQYQFEVSRRRPDLLTLAYGTNEAFDNTNPERYAEHYRELVGRVRAAVPDISCWIIGAPDAATSDGRSITRLGPILAVQRSVARELGCAFTSAQAVMGGERSFENWLRASPPLARGDRIHLTILGYETLGKGLGLSLLPETTSSVTLGGR